MQDSTTSPELRLCNRKELCIHPDMQSGWLPATSEYFYRSNGRLIGRCKCCFKAQSRERYHNNLEYEHKRRRQYFLDNRETVLEKSRERYQRDREQLREYWRQYRLEKRDRAARQKYKAANRDKIQAYQKRYEDEHRHEVNLRLRSWRARNPERNRANMQRRRARTKGAGGSFTASDVSLLMSSQKHLCWWCGEKIADGNYHVDHRIPLSRGGSNAPENLCISCPQCNLSKNDKLPQEWNGRLL